MSAAKQSPKTKPAPKRIDPVDDTREDLTQAKGQAPAGDIKQAALDEALDALDQTSEALKQTVDGFEQVASLASGGIIPGTPEQILETKPSWFAKFLHNWQELIVWKPILIGVLIGMWFGIPQLDSRSGIDGFGDLFHLALRAVFISALFFAVWLVKRTYFRELPSDEEETLWLRIQIDRPVLALILDRLETGAILCAIAILLLR